MYIIGTDRRLALGLAALLGAVACDRTAAPDAATATPAAVSDSSPSVIDPAAAFLAALRPHCGLAYAGKVLVDHPPSEPNPFSNATLVMHLRDCDEDQIRIPFSVGEDRSRTWVLTRTETGLRLKHVHRHADGSLDAVSNYGGDSDPPGTAMRQSFPVDAESIATFQANGLTASLNNTWALEIESEHRFLYELSRPSGRLFQVEFDLSTPVDLPPPAWGEDTDGANAQVDHHHHHDGPAPLELSLNQGQRWATDGALRSGMQRMRQAFDDRLAGPELAAEIDASIVYLIQNCELEPAADANLHLLLAELSAAANALKQSPADTAALASVEQALRRYGEYFDHPDWQPSQQPRD